MGRYSNGEEPIFIKLPVRNGGWQYVEVDIGRCDKKGFNFFRKRKLNDRNATHPYIPITGNLVLENDFNLLAQKIDELLSNAKEILCCQGEKGCELWKKIDELGLKDLLENAFQKDIQVASKYFEDLVYFLVYLASCITEKENELTSSQARFDELEKTVLNMGGIKDNIYQDWGMATDEMIADYDKLQEIATKITQEREQLIAKFNTIKFSESEIQKDRRLILGDDSNDGLLHFFQFVLSQDSEKPIARLKHHISIATSIIQKHEARQLKAADLLREIESSVKKRLVNLKTAINGLEASYRARMKEFNEYEVKFGSRIARPWEESTGGIISKESYGFAKNLASNPEYSPLRLKTKLHANVDSALALANTSPQIPADFLLVLNRCKTSLEKISSYRKGKTETTSETETLIPDKRAEDKPLVSEQSRLEELYELIIIAAYVTTCKFHYGARSSIKTLLYIVSYLDKCTVEEIYTYLESIKKLANNRKHWETVTDSKQVIPRWKKSSCAWISYQHKGFWCIKLSLSMKSQAEKLMEKHSITAEQVKNANTKRKLNYKDTKKA